MQQALRRIPFIGPIKQLARTLYHRYRAAGYPLLPLTRLIRGPLRWYYHRSPLLRHDNRFVLKPYLLFLLHDALVRDLPHDFTIYQGKLRFRSSGSIMSLHGYYVGEIEYHLLQFLRSQIRDNFVMLDVGAHHGLFSLIAAYELKAHSYSGKIYSFEPHPDNFALLRHNLSQNQLADYAQIYNAAVAAAGGQGSLVVNTGENSDNALESAANPAAAAGPVVRQRVDVVALDELCKHERVDLIKIDVQGGEPAVLAGAEQIIVRDRPVIIVEAVQEWQSTAEVRAFLLAHNYTIYGVDQQGALCAPNSDKAYISWDWVGVPQ
jgi:FkbM family methyltransferase